MGEGPGALCETEINGHFYRSALAEAILKLNSFGFVHRQPVSVKVGLPALSWIGSKRELQRYR